MSGLIIHYYQLTLYHNVIFGKYHYRWPEWGEIDIIEYVNRDRSNIQTLHTKNGCNYTSIAESINNTIVMNGKWLKNTNCYVNAPNQAANTGCSIGSSTSPVGATFNAVGGGVYAMEWYLSKYIRIYYFDRASIPQDLRDKNPNPDNWGLPKAVFTLNDKNICTDNFFIDHNIIFSNTFCGAFAGTQFSQCSQTISCSSFVQQNPSEFAEDYWLINYLDIYNIPNNVTQRPVTMWPSFQPSPQVANFAATATTNDNLTNSNIFLITVGVAIGFAMCMWLSHCVIVHIRFRKLNKQQQLLHKNPTNSNSNFNHQADNEIQVMKSV